ncbi:putative reverse transcriptase zinc-binding domain-containing protein [Helianthus annuus]|nr:putative reverse transcriptase zinc-binding domain-containing protein [Helianthus annuus]
MTSADELVQRVNLCGLLTGEDADSGQDEWYWAAANDSGFSTNATTKMLMQRTDFGNNFILKWVSWVPLKCSIMAWRAEMNRLPTKMAHIRRNVAIPDSSCSWCNYNDETVMHVLSDCIIASNVWDWIGRWCRLDPIYAFEIKDLLEVYKSVKGCKKMKNLVQGIIVVAMEG